LIGIDLNNSTVGLEGKTTNTMVFVKSSQCTEEVYVGYAPLSYFIIGSVEVVFSGLLTIVLFKRKYFPSLSRSSYVSYILPLYVSLVVPLLLTCFLVGLHSILGVYLTNIYLLIFKWFLLRSVSESLSLFFLHAGIGVHSAIQSLSRGFLWTAMHAAAEAAVYAIFGLDGVLFVSIAILIELLLFYGAMMVIPMEKLPRRPALQRYALLCILLLLYQLAAVSSFAFGPQGADASCLIENNFLVCEFLQVLALLYAFYTDSKFWQGLHVDAKNNLNEPLLGIWDMNRDAVNLVTDSVIQLEREANIIPFNRLRVDTRLVDSLTRCLLCLFWLWLWLWLWPVRSLDGLC
jgi:hypothetical protein